jgi:EAL domain-containing protein (putative c-di-GMP-specific phosphodiesterase class I)
MPQTVLLIHDDAAKAKIVQDALLNSIDGFFIVEWVELCSEAVQPLAINISAVELRSNNFVDHVRAILQETGVEPRYIEFELTET